MSFDVYNNLYRIWGWIIKNKDLLVKIAFAKISYMVVADIEEALHPYYLGVKD